MKTEQVIERLKVEAFDPNREHVYLKKEDAKRLLERVNSLEMMAADLLRSLHGSGTVITFEEPS